MYKYTIKSYFTIVGISVTPIIIKVKETTNYLAIQKAKQICPDNNHYEIIEIEEL